MGALGIKDLLGINDLTREKIELIFKEAEHLKNHPITSDLKDKNIALVFAKSSTRTRVSFEVGVNQMGGHALFLDMKNMQSGRGEAIKDTAMVLSRYCDGIMARLFAHEDIVELAKYSRVPVINGLTDLLHPCQVLSDMFTIKERFRKLEGLGLAFVGDGKNNVTHSLMIASAILGLKMNIGCPRGYEPDKGIVNVVSKISMQTGSSPATVFNDPVKAVKGVDVVYTDTWVSMGMEKEKAKREKAFPPFQVNSKLLKHAKDTAIVMHDLPAYRGKEITDEVMDGVQSVIFDQAENRLHVQKAIMKLLFK